MLVVPDEYDHRVPGSSTRGCEAAYAPVSPGRNSIRVASVSGS
jgi:hypothetical protein